MRHKVSFLKIALIISILIGGAAFYHSKLVSAQPTGTEGAAQPQASLISPDLMLSITKIESINVDDKIFSDPVFQSLEDYTVTLIEEPSGRPNPFAPVQSQSRNPSNSRSRPGTQ
jgi:hypothetical protein